MSLRPRLRASAPTAIALTALVVALGGPAWAAGLIDGRDIRKGTVSSRQVKDRTLRERDLARGTLRALTAVPNGAVGPTSLADNAVTTRAIAPGSVLTGTVADNSLTAADLAPNAAGADEVADNAVGQGEIRNNGVGSTELADNTVDGDKVVDGSLSLRDLARQTGTFALRLDAILPTRCREASFPLPGADAAGAVVIATPAPGWPSGLTYTVGRTSAGHELWVQACNGGAALSPAGTYAFNYLVLFL